MKYGVFCLVVSLMVSGCSVSNESTSSAVKESAYADTSKTSLDWNGEYQGLLPCADCEGIEIKLTSTHMN